tara:strand:+ start:3942 stop:4772 length:831 start_codon:yes stop_codon:yes gene_type:complete
MRAYFTILSYILVALIASCGQIVREAKVPIDSYSAKEIFDLGEKKLDLNRPVEAAGYFGEIERLFPYSEFTKRGLVMQAFSFHKALDYPNSRSSAQRYLNFYPASEDAAYAQYILALSYYDQIADVGRDQAITLKALRELRILIERYPDSNYDDEAEIMFDLAFGYLAAKEMEVGRYYLQKGHHSAAVNRFRVVVQDFRDSSQTPEALYRLIEGYLSLGLHAEAQSAGAVLAEQYGSSDWFENSILLLDKNGLSPDALNDNWLSQIYRQMIKGQWL